MSPRIKPEKLIVGLYGACAVSMLGLHIAGFATGNNRLHTLGWYVLIAGIAVGSVPLAFGLLFVLFNKLKSRQ